MIDPDKLMGRFGNRMFQYAYLYSQARSGVIPDTYVQDPTYFDEYSDEIKQLFGKDIGFLPYVSVHVRRGDYVDNSFYVDLSKTNYYEKAIELFPNKNFLVFSDDPEFCKKIFTGKEFQVMDGGTELEDFNMMASCESNIIANSSYSWWAGYLNPNPTKKVIAPNAWHPDGVERTKCPDDWIKI